MGTTDTTRDEHLYLRLAGLLEGQIARDVLRLGDRLPSVRVLSREHGVSISTALQTYYHLEAKGLIEARPKSGYFVSFSPRSYPAMPGKTAPLDRPAEQREADDMIADVFDHLTDAVPYRFSLSAPAPELLPIARLNKTMIEALRELPAGGTYYEDIQGNLRLRRQIARRAGLWEGRLTEDDVVTTAGCMNALALALMTLTGRGDTIAVESPTYFGILQLARSLGLRVLELPTDPQTGVDPDAVKRALETENVRVCLFASHFNNPLGASMPEEHQRAVV
jgi:DNA-binding transcriptional MocR family regulator